MLRRFVPVVFALAFALALPLSAHAGLYAPAESLLISDEATFVEEPIDATAACSGTMSAGVAKREIIPGDLQPDGSWRMWVEPFEDVNGNGVYDAHDPLDPETAPGEPYTDENGNGKWDAPFMAGYGHEKESNEYYVAASVHDMVWARAVAISCGDVTLGLVAVDTVGLFRGVVNAIRASAPAEYDHIVVASTHTHDSFDTMGLWGAHQLSDGKHPRAMEKIHDQAVAALADALADRAPVSMASVASGHTRDRIPVAGTLQTDLRDPFVLDDKVVALRLDRASDDIVLVNWAPHPETLAGTKSEISSDYPHYLREALEARYGGTAVFFSGAVGGMMTTLGASPKYPDGTLVPDHSYEKARVIGETAADIAGDALDAADALAPRGLRVQSRVFNVPADNAFLLAINSAGVLDHETAIGYVELPGVGPGILVPAPFLRAEVDVVSLLGEDGQDLLQVLTIPGEMLPEVAYGNPLRTEGEPTLESCFAFNPDKLLFNGGRNGKWNPATGEKEPGYERVLASKPAYPTEPAVATMTTARETMLFGLANDELGYMVPANDFEPATYFPELYSDGRDRCGDDDHYEETNSASSMLAMTVANNLAKMLDPEFEPAPMPSAVTGLLDDGVWVDTDPSGAYEENEDARVQVPGIPGGLPGCWGFLNGHNEDEGQEPSDAVRGLWVDVNGDCRFGPGDGAVFADMWALSEGQPHWRP